MNVLLIVSTFVLCLYGLSPVDCDMFYEEPSPYRRPNGCYSNELGHMTQGQKTKVDGDCLQLSCEDNGGITHYGCGIIDYSDGCIQYLDPSKPYPVCCKQRKC